MIENYKENFNYLFYIKDVDENTRNTGNVTLKTKCNPNDRILTTFISDNYRDNDSLNNSFLKKSKRKIDPKLNINNLFEEGKIQLYAKVLDLDFMVKL